MSQVCATIHDQLEFGLAGYDLLYTYFEFEVEAKSKNYGHSNKEVLNELLNEYFIFTGYGI